MSASGKAFASTALLATAFGAARLEPAHRDLGSEVLGATDGWAAFGAGTSGGSTATDANVFVVKNRRELIAALNQGTIDANVDDQNGPLRCDDYNRNGYTLEAYLQTYEPAVWGMNPQAGPLEQARIASQMAQQARVRIRVGSKTTLGRTATRTAGASASSQESTRRRTSSSPTTRSRRAASSRGSTGPPSSRCRRRSTALRTTVASGAGPFNW